MPLQLRRGTTAERLSITPLPGEPILDTDLNTIFIGNGITPGGISALTGVTAEEAQDLVGQMFLNGQHDGLIFTYGPTQDAANRIDVKLDFSSYDGEFVASAFRGPLFADDSSLIINSVTKAINATSLTVNNIDADSISVGSLIVNDIKGSIFGDDSTLLVDAVDSSINLDGTVKGNIVPNTNETYDIGSFGSRFRDIYLSGTSIFLGNANITATGTAVNLPAGSTVGGVPIGSGGGDGVVEGSNYNINIMGNDSSYVVDADNKILTGSLIGNVTGNVIGNVSGNVIGDLTGNVTGYHTGDVKGSVFADDSSILVDAITGTFTGNLIGGHVGNVFTNSITSIDSSAISIIPLVIMNSDLVVENDLSVSNDIVASNLFGRFFGDISSNQISTNNIQVTTISGNNSGVITHEVELLQKDALIIQNENDNNTSMFGLRKHANNANFGARSTYFRSRGTESLPLAISNGDVLSVISSGGYDGSDYVTGAAISVVSSGAVSAGVVPASIEFGTMNSSGNFASRGRFTSAGNFELFQPMLMARTNVLSDFMILQQFTSSPNDSSNITFTRARGTQSVPTAASSNDAIIDLASAAFDGTTYTGSSTIRMNIDGAVSPGIVPGRIEFWTSDSLGIQTKKAQFNKDGILQVDRIEALTANLSIVGDLIGSVFSDTSTMVIDGTDGSIKYYPGTPADWAGTPPTTVGEAIDRLAARLKLIDGGVGA